MQGCFIISFKTHITPLCFKIVFEFIFCHKYVCTNTVTHFIHQIDLSLTFFLYKYERNTTEMEFYNFL